jgi:hypothetical protein
VEAGYFLVVAVDADDGHVLLLLLIQHRLDQQQ